MVKYQQPAREKAMYESEKAKAREEIIATQARTGVTMENHINTNASSTTLTTTNTTSNTKKKP